MLYTNQEIAKRKERENRIKKVITIIIYIILIPVLIINISLIIQSLYRSDKTPSFFGIKTYVVVSGSMNPTINIGDLVITKNIENEKEEINIGDIIAFRRGQSVITHRIINIEPDENGILIITTKGDNNNTNDSETILINNIEGKVVDIIPNLGKFVLIFQEKIIIMIFIIIWFIYISRSDKTNERKMERHIKRQEYEKWKRMQGEMI